MHAADMLLVAAFFDAQLIRWVVWVGLVILTVALLLLIRTRWGGSQPLGKCIVLSLVAHLLLAIYISTVNIVTATVGSPDGQGIQVALVDGGLAAGDDSASERPDRPAGEAFDGFADRTPSESLGATPDLAAAAPAAAVPDIPEPERMTPVEPPRPAASTPPVPTPVIEEAAPPEIAPRNEGPSAESSLKDVQPIESPPESKTPDPVPPPEPAKDSGTNDKPGSEGAKGGSTTGQTKVDVPPLVPIPGRPGGGGDGGKAKGVPDELKLRTGDHTQVAKGHGATQASEAAVNAALKWLAANQGASGRWEAGRTGAGAGRASDGQDRFGAGTTADTGITGLALLSFLAAGNTHLQGQHQLTVRKGLQFLLSMQDADGNLGASNNMYEKMYCHAMATCALSEAYAMSRDDRLQAAVRRAIGYTVESQDPKTGGWRYRPNDPGDTSQLGWQVMALKSAQLAGLDIPQQTRGGIERFLKSVSLGRDGGLACYQSIRAVPSRSMTAEALACRQFLGIQDTPAALAEANKYVLEEVPGTGTTNFYYWYYGTLSMYQSQGEAWTKWNDALQKKLIATQRSDGPMAGSWDPDPVWGGCGGRAYSTALGALCLEVYYRFLPLLVQAPKDGRVK